ncbi:hypothetical protein C8A00DRAFT_32074 [Chaetomidium leptoderma]|uniref:Uncharacterized protein n=1 Tax=Chaetomidium leptoderma TaxID=669021 RepID=A0AAN6VNY7_9PEZI|nr:hypothetical protein C8A00DRAFT_32074 [Chaetomidium leptoderma]
MPPYRLAAQEDVAGTYMENPYTAGAIQDYLVKGQPEGMTSTIWNTLLKKYFPDAEGYLTKPEMVFGDGKADLYTAHIVHGARKSLQKFLIVECKTAGLETQRSIWKEGANQLERYLRSIKGDHRKFGAIAIGKHVRFYELIDTFLVDFDDDGEIYLLDRQCQSVSGKLIYFRDNHLSPN